MEESYRSCGVCRLPAAATGQWGEVQVSTGGCHPEKGKRVWSVDNSRSAERWTSERWVCLTHQCATHSRLVTPSQPGRAPWSLGVAETKPSMAWASARLTWPASLSGFSPPTCGVALEDNCGRNQAIRKQADGNDRGYSSRQIAVRKRTALAADHSLTSSHLALTGKSFF